MTSLMTVLQICGLLSDHFTALAGRPVFGPGFLKDQPAKLSQSL